ncbi:cupredoxin domain-containing protein [Paenibacillus sp. J5C_2022]|uniref:cupredoxin domain-containing protein n=1 Tax=Paenibacillus sp. J5C2022 TaxID=2977129 RepID=UPI0021CFB2D7|nr:cupredoxin domain-containing protein [Paenibacillus sp. J5C2022]MCU6710329.1 cupredoxin domain-containing protein [Paenibacillus sp. J5C2022]
MKKWVVFISILSIALVVAACGANSGGNKPAGGTAEGSGEENSAPASSGSGLTITASNWEFDKEEYKIKAGEKIDLTFKSIDGVHGMTIMKTDYKNIGMDETVAVKIDEPGTYNIVCSVSCGVGHAKMRAKLIVE